MVHQTKSQHDNQQQQHGDLSKREAGNKPIEQRLQFDELRGGTFVQRTDSGDEELRLEFESLKGGAIAQKTGSSGGGEGTAEEEEETGPEQSLEFGELKKGTVSTMVHNDALGGGQQQLDFEELRGGTAVQKLGGKTGKRPGSSGVGEKGEEKDKEDKEKMGGHREPKEHGMEPKEEDHEREPNEEDHEREPNEEDEEEHEMEPKEDEEEKQEQEPKGEEEHGKELKEEEEPKEQEQGLEGGEEPKKIEIEEPEGSQVGLTGNGFFVSSSKREFRAVDTFYQNFSIISHYRHESLLMSTLLSRQL